MNKATLIALFMAACALSACGGGGGGGGGGHRGDPGQIYPLPSAPQTGESAGTTNVSIFSFSPAPGVDLSGHVDFKVTKTSDGLRMEAFADEAARDFTFSAANDDFKETPDGKFIMAVKETGATQVSNNLAVGTFSALDVLYLGGKMAGLQHSEFGIWHSYRRYIPTGGVISSHRWDDTVYILGGDDAEKNAFSSGAGQLTFNGKALGSVREYGPNTGPFGTTAELFGTAQLNVDLNNLSNANMKLAFDNFYTFTATGIDMRDTNGVINSNTALSVVNNGNTTGISFDASRMESSDITGQAYGTHPGDSNPTEVTGTFYFLDRTSIPDGYYVRVNGTYGVKR